MECVQTKVTELVSNLGISQGLEEKILDRLWPVASRKLKWTVKNAEFKEMEGLPDIILTDRGKVNSSSTADSIIMNKRFSILQRFNLSHLVGRIDASRELWQEMSSEEKATFLKNKVYPIDDFMLSIIQETSEGKNYYPKTVKFALESGCLELIKYFFRTMSEENKKDAPIQFLEVLSIELDIQAFLEEENIEVCFFLLNQMDDETKELCFLKYPCLLLCCFLEYPDVSYFKAYFKQALINEMPIEKVYVLLKFIFYKFHLGEFNYDKYRLLFVEVWRIIPSDIQKFLKKRTDLGPLCGSIIIKHQFPFLLREGGYFEMERFISGDLKSITSGSSLRFDFKKWQLLKTLMEEKLITVRNMKRHKILELSGTDMSNLVAWKEMKRLLCRISKYKL